MAGFGETLRQARAHKNVTLREAELETRINRHHLAALEDESFDALPPQIYTRGIVRKYADYLGLDAGKVLDMYREAAGVGRDISPMPSTPVEMPRMWAPNFAIVAFGVVLTAIVFAWGYSILLSPSGNSNDIATATTTSAVTTQTADTPRPTAPAAPTVEAVASSSNQTPVIGGDNQSGVETEVYRTGISLVLEADADIYFEVDGQAVLDGPVAGGTETEMFVGTDFVITSSNPDMTYFKNSCGLVSETPMPVASATFNASAKSCPAPQ